MLTPQLVHRFTHAALSPDPDLAIAALMIARIEHPNLDAAPYLDLLDALGTEAARRVAAASVVPGDAPARVDPDRYARVMALNEYLFEEMRFVGNEVQYDDPRNSFLNDVLDRRTGIPITLALVYLEVARRAGLDAPRVLANCETLWFHFDGDTLTGRVEVDALSAPHGANAAEAIE